MASRRTAVWLAIAVVLATSIAAYAGGTITWTSTGGPTGGSVNALAVSPEASGFLYAGTNTGVFLSRDDGATWNPVSTDLPDDRTITALAVAADPKVVFAGTRAGVYATRNAGVTWTSSDPRIADQLILSLLIDPRTQSTLYAGTLTTVWRSDNNGENWQDIGEGLSPVRVNALAITSDASLLFAATDAGIFLSRNRGTAWQPFSEGLSDGARPQAIAITSKTAFAGTTQGLYRLRDTRWVSQGAPFSGAPVRALIADPRHPERVFAVTTKGFYKSVDGGDSWTPIQSVPGGTGILALVAGDKSALYAGTTRGVWKSADEGNSWNPLNTGLVSTSINALLIPPEKPGAILAATRAGLASSPDRGATWQEIRDLTDINVSALAVDPSTRNAIYASAFSGALYLSNDGGASFTRLGESAANAPISSLAIVPLAPNARAIYAGTQGSGLLLSNDDGKTWRARSSDLPGVTRVAELAFFSPILYAGTDRGLYRLDQSKPDSQWQIVSAELPTEEPSAIIAHPHNPQSLYVAFISKGIYRTDDGGTQWQSLNRGEFPTRVRFQTLAITTVNAPVLYVGTDRGIYRSEDNGASWSAANQGLPTSADVEAIAIDPESAGRVFAGTDGYGVLVGTEEFRAAPGTDWQLPAAVAGAIVLAAGAIAVAWQTRFSPAAQERVWGREFPAWESAIHHALWTFGQANEINLTRLPHRKLLRALQRYKDLHEADALTLSTEPMLALKLDNYLPAQKFLSHWKAAWEVVDSEGSFQTVTSQMVDQLCQLLGFTRVDERAFQGTLGYVVKAPALRLKIPPRFPIIFLPHHEIAEEQVSILRDLMNVLSMTSYFALIVDLRDLPPRDKQSLKRLVRQTIHDFIVLDGIDIRRLLAARDHPRRLVEIILDQVDLTVVSPYVTSGPVPENMFFGRDNEIKTIIRTVRDTNFAIVGGRKIGKTSVLARVNRFLQDQPDTHPFYLDCQAVHTYEDFFQAVDTAWTVHLPTRTMEGLRRMATDLGVQYPGKTIVMLFDEIDALLKHDVEHGEQLFRILRALSQENHIRYIFCGEKVLSGSLHDPNLVFFNFCNILNLSYLTDDEARRVVAEPMEEMGITLEDDGTLVEEIINQSARHPNIIQYLCQELIKRINVRRERLVRRSDLNTLAHSAQFAEYFIEVCWGRSNALERLITLLMLDQPEASLTEIGDALRARGVSLGTGAMERALDGLCLYSILKKDGPKYAFATDAFPRILRRSQDVAGLRDSLIAETQSTSGASG